MKIHKNPIEEAFTAKSKASGRVVNFASQQNRDNAIKSGEYEETDDAGGEPAPAKPKVNIFDKPKPQAKPASDADGDSKPSSTVAPPVVKTPVDVLKGKVEKWSEKEKAFFRDGIHKQDSPERRNWKDAIKDKAKGAIAAIKKGAKHEVEEFKAAGAGVKNFFSGKELSEHEKKALKSVAIKVATTAIFGAVTGGAGHGVLAFGKHVAMEFIPHVVGETILKGAGTAALFAGDEEEDVYMERFMAIIADKMASEKITPELMNQMVDSYNAKKGEGGEEVTNEEVSQLTPDQSEMVNGIIEMLLQIKDIDNRMEVAQQQIQNFKDEGIDFNYAGFLSAAGLDNNDEPIMMNTKTLPNHILHTESIMNEEFKHIISVDTPTQIVSKPVAAQIMALAKKGVRSKDIGLKMGFVGNQKMATDAFQKVKNKIYFELGKKFEAVNINVEGTEQESPEETLASLKRMAMGDLERIEDYAEMISDRMEQGQELSAWMYSQITLAVDQLNAVHDTMDGKDGIKESINEEKYTVIDPTGNQMGASDKMQAVSIAKKRGGEKAGYFVVPNKNALKARRALEKFKGDFKNPKLKDMMADLFYESVEEAKSTTISAPGNWVAFLSMTKGKMLLKVFDTARGAKQYLSKNVDKLLGLPHVESVGIMTKKQWDEREAKYAIEGVVSEAKYPTDLKVGSIVMGQGFTRLKGIDGGKYYKIVAMDDTTATLVSSDKNGNQKGSSKVRHKLDSIEGGIKTAKRGDENGIVIIKESSEPSAIVKDLDKVKNDLLKKVDVLIAKKKKLYSDVDITTPMSADEKKLDKDIADLFSQINNLVLQKRSLKEETINEKKYYVTYNKGRGQGKGLSMEFDKKTFRPLDKPKVFNSYKDAKKYADDMEKVFRNSIGGGTAYWVSDEKMNPIKESMDESTPGEQIQNLNNRLTKLRQDMAKAKSPEAKNVIQAKMKNALQKLSNKKKELGIKKP